jgi:hypothetical protein
MGYDRCQGSGAVTLGIAFFDLLTCVTPASRCISIIASHLDTKTRILSSASLPLSLEPLLIGVVQDTPAAGLKKQQEENRVLKPSVILHGFLV